LPDEDLAYELLSCKKITELVGLPCFASDTYEADDLISDLFEHAVNENLEPYVLSRDKDLGQVLKEDMGYLWDYGYDDPIAYQSFANEFGIAPSRMAEFLAIAGDTSDAIAGIRGVGKKTVAALFEQMGPWQDIKNNLDQIPSLSIRGAKGLAVKIQDHLELVENNLKLTTLHNNCISPNERVVSVSEVNKNALMSLLEEFKAPETIFKQVEKLSL